MTVLTKAKLTCPQCGFSEELEMPLDACQFFHECSSCKAVLSPRPGDCCVFCSYADSRCPPKQSEGANTSP